MKKLNILLAIFIIVSIVIITANSHAFSPKETFDLAVMNLESKDPYKRIDGARELIPLKMKAAYRHFINGLRDENKDVRYLCALGLGELKDKRAVGSLTRLLNDENTLVREGAVKALGMIGTKSIIQPLIRTLKKNMGSMHKKDLVTWRASQFDQGALNVCTAIIPILGRMKTKAAVPVLLQIMERDLNNTSNVVLVQETIIALKNIGDKRAVKPIIKVVRNNKLDPYIIQTAKTALVELGISEDEVDDIARPSDSVDKILKDSHEQSYEKRRRYGYEYD